MRRTLLLLAGVQEAVRVCDEKMIDAVLALLLSGCPRRRCSIHPFSHSTSTRETVIKKKKNDTLAEHINDRLLKMVLPSTINKPLGPVGSKVVHAAAHTHVDHRGRACARIRQQCV